MRNRLNNFLTTNPWLKLASLVLAVILWFFVVSKGRSVTVMDVPIVFTNIPANLEVVKKPEKISISIKGQKRLLKKLTQDDIAVTIDLSNIKKGESFFSINNDNLTLPNTFTVAEISPQTIKLLIEKKIKKHIPVRPVIIGLPAQGFLLKRVEVVPKTVEITGTENVVSKVYSIKTKPIDITGITGTLQYHASLNVDKKNNIRVDIPEVNVNVFVEKIK